MPTSDSNGSPNALYDVCVCSHVRGGHGQPGDAAVQGRSSTACTVCGCPRFGGDTWWRRSLRRARAVVTRR